MYSQFDGRSKRFKALKTIWNKVVLDDVLSDAYSRFKTIKVTGREDLEEEHQIQAIAGRNGAYYMGKTHKPRTIEVVCLLEAKDRGRLTRAFRKLHQLLNTVNPVPLAFSDDEGYFFWAKFQAMGRPEVQKDGSVFTVTFLCYDPYKYSDYKTGNGNGIAYTGDMPSRPVITLRLTRSGSELRLLHVQKQVYVRLTGSFNIGNVVTIDMEAMSVKIGDVVALERLDMVNSRFFSLDKGENRLTCNLATEVSVRYREVLLC